VTSRVLLCDLKDWPQTSPSNYPTKTVYHIRLPTHLKVYSLVKIRTSLSAAVARQAWGAPTALLFEHAQSLIELTGSKLAPSYYLIATAALSLLALLIMRHRYRL
jgi:hypothetical protein